MNRFTWFLSMGTWERREPVMEDVDLGNRIFREQRMPIHQQRTSAELGSASRPAWPDQAGAEQR
jgi:hypothetical protein